MASRAPLPWLGMALAAVALSGAAASGTGAGTSWLLGAVWLASLWIDRLRPGPPQPHIPAPVVPDYSALARTAMAEGIESVGVPLVMLVAHRITAANAVARATLGAHIIGQDARIALRHPDAVRLLSLSDGDSVTIRGLTTPRSLWQLTRRPIDAPPAAGAWMIELADRTTEADVGRAYTDFVANASHELRTPLASIIGYVETLSEGETLDPPTTARFLAVVLREARRMQSLVADLMSLSRLEAEKHDAPTARVDLGQLAARVVGEFQGAPANQPPRLRLESTDEAAAPTTVTGDSHQLEQLLRNLIDNAFKYGDPAAAVEVRVAPPVGQFAVVTVADRGAGIGSEHLPHLTRRFYRTDAGRSRAAGGTGLGLAIVKHIVERHRGELGITSAPGEGTVVTVRLPLAAAPVRVAAPAG